MDRPAPSYAKEELLMMVAVISTRWRPWNNTICPHPE
jgi:hypothetical protein